MEGTNRDASTFQWGISVYSEEHVDTCLEQILRIAPATWPGAPLRLQPGDLSRFIPSGLGLNGPAMAQPWDRLEDLAQRPKYYGFTQPSSDPLKNAPVNEAAGGGDVFPIRG